MNNSADKTRDNFKTPSPTDDVLNGPKLNSTLKTLDKIPIKQTTFSPNFKHQVQPSKGFPQSTPIKTKPKPPPPTEQKNNARKSRRRTFITDVNIEDGFENEEDDVVVYNSDNTSSDDGRPVRDILADTKLKEMRLRTRKNAVNKVKNMKHNYHDTSFLVEHVLTTPQEVRIRNQIKYSEKNIRRMKTPSAWSYPGVDEAIQTSLDDDCILQYTHPDQFKLPELNQKNAMDETTSTKPAIEGIVDEVLAAVAATTSPPPTRIPAKYYVSRVVPILSEKDREQDVTFNGRTGHWETLDFPSRVPVSRVEVVHLAKAFEAMLKQVEERNLNLPEHIENCLEVIDIVISEIARQIHVQCAERGVLLTRANRMQMAWTKKIMNIYRQFLVDNKRQIETIRALEETKKKLGEENERLDYQIMELKHELKMKDKQINVEKEAIEKLKNQLLVIREETDRQIQRHVESTMEKQKQQEQILLKREELLKERESECKQRMDELTELQQQAAETQKQLEQKYIEKLKQIETVYENKIDELVQKQKQQQELLQRQKEEFEASRELDFLDFFDAATQTDIPIKVLTRTKHRGIQAVPEKLARPTLRHCKSLSDIYRDWKTRNDTDIMTFTMVEKLLKPSLGALRDNEEAWKKKFIEKFEREKRELLEALDNEKKNFENEKEIIIMNMRKIIRAESIMKEKKLQQEIDKLNQELKEKAELIAKLEEELEAQKSTTDTKKGRKSRNKKHKKESNTEKLQETIDKQSKTIEELKAQIEELLQDKEKADKESEAKTETSDISVHCKLSAGRPPIVATKDIDTQTDKVTSVDQLPVSLTETCTQTTIHDVKHLSIQTDHSETIIYIEKSKDSEPKEYMESIIQTDEIISRKIPSENVYTQTEYQPENDISVKSIDDDSTDFEKQTDEHPDSESSSITDTKPRVSVYIQTIPIRMVNATTSTKISARKTDPKLLASDGLGSITVKPTQFWKQLKQMVKKNVGKKVIDLFEYMKGVNVKGKLHSTRWICKVILDIYEELAKSEDLQHATDTSFMETFILGYHMVKYGLQSITNSKLASLLKTLKHNYQKHNRVKMFVQFCEMTEKLKHKPLEYYNIQTLKFFLYALTLTKALLGTRPLRELEHGEYRISLDFGINIIQRLKSFEDKTQRVIDELTQMFSKYDGRYHQNLFNSSCSVQYDVFIEFVVKRYYCLFIAHKELIEDESEEEEIQSPKLPYPKFKKLITDLFGKLIILDQSTLKCKYRSNVTANFFNSSLTRSQGKVMQILRAISDQSVQTKLTIRFKQILQNSRGNQFVEMYLDDYVQFIIDLLAAEKDERRIGKSNQETLLILCHKLKRNFPRE